MARTRVITEPALHSWEDVDDALRQIAEEQIVLNDIENDLQKQLTGAQKVANDLKRPHKDRIAQLARDLERFVTDHRDDLGKKKSRTLTFGEVGFRASTSISVSTKPEKLAEIIRRLKARKMLDCIITKESVSKEVLKKYGQDTVNAVGAVWKQDETFGYDVNVAKLEQIKAGL